jgi:hypothetical protein
VAPNARARPEVADTKGEYSLLLALTKGEYSLLPYLPLPIAYHSAAFDRAGDHLRVLWAGARRRRPALPVHQASALA